MKNRSLNSPSASLGSRASDLYNKKTLSRKRTSKHHRRPIVNALIESRLGISKNAESQRLNELKIVKANFKLEENDGKYEMVVWPPQPPFFKSEIKQGKKVDPNFSLSDKSTVVELNEGY